MNRYPYSGARGARPALAAGLLALALLVPLVSGCGGAASLQMSIERPAEEKGAVWVGVYFLSKPSALDGKSIAELIDKPEASKAVDGVVDQEVFSLQPGRGPRAVLREEYEKRLNGVNTILVVANFPKPGDCARHKETVKQGDSVNLLISVAEKCLSVKKK